ncbi:MAG: hypothetical protein RR340_09900, partial [Cloacibacillus sp.]
MGKEHKISTRLSLDGEAEFKRGMDNSSASMRAIRSEMALATSEFTGQANSIAALTSKHNVLQKQVDTQTAKVSACNKALQEARSLYDDNSDEVQKYQILLNYAKTDLNKFSTELNQNDKYMTEAKTSTDGCATSIDEYGKKVKKATDDSKRFGNDGASSVKKLGEAFASSKVAEYAIKIEKALFSCVKAASAYADEVGTVSAQTGIAAKDLQGYMYAAELVDVDLETLTKSMAKQIKSMGAYKDGTKTIVAAYKALGVTAMDSDRHLRNSNDVYWELIDALGRMTNETERDELAMKLLGKSAQELNPLIKAGSGAMKEWALEAQNMGYVLSDETLEQLSSFDDQMQRLNNSSDAFKNSVGAAMAPLFKTIAADGTDALSALTAFAQQNPDTLQAFTAIVASAGGASAALAAFKATAAGLKAVGISLAGLGIASTVGAIAGLGAVSIVGTANYMDTLVAKTDDLTTAQKELDDATANLNIVMEQYGNTVWEAGTPAATDFDMARIAVGIAQQQVDKLSETQDAAAASSDNLAARQEALSATMEGVSGDLSELMTAYQDAYIAAYNSIDGQAGLFDTLSVNVSASVDDMTAALQSQVDYMNSYAENIAQASEMGLSDGLLKELSDGSAESAAYLQAIVDGGDAQIQALNDQFAAVQESKDTFAAAVAEAQTAFSTKIGEIIDEAGKAANELDLHDDARAAATSTIVSSHAPGRGASALGAHQYGLVGGRRPAP